MNSTATRRLTKADLPEGYEVVKDPYEIGCDHMACDVMHRHLYNATYADGVRNVNLYNIEGEWIGTRNESRFHMKTINQWVILLNGERVGDAHDTQQGAFAEVVKHKPTI